MLMAAGAKNLISGSNPDFDDFYVIFSKNPKRAWTIDFSTFRDIFGSGRENVKNWHRKDS